MSCPPSTSPEDQVNAVWNQIAADLREALSGSFVGQPVTVERKLQLQESITYVLGTFEIGPL